MQSMNPYRTTIRVMDCPGCRKPQTSLVKFSSDEWTCPACGSVVVKDEEIPDALWRWESVDAIDCVCGTEITLTDDNLFRSPSGGVWYLCPNRTAHGGDALVGVVRFRNSWLPPGAFFRRAGKDGLMIPSEAEDFMALDLIVALAQVEHPEFQTILPGASSKLFWLNGNLAGYFVYTNEPNGIPILNQIYVLPQHRRRGYGTSMIEDFLDMFPSGFIAIEIPLSEEVGRILARLGLVELSDGAFSPMGRVRFVSGPF